MDKGKAPAQDTSAMMAQGIEQARAAMENYLNFFQNNMSAAPWAGTELNKKLAAYAQQKWRLPLSTYKNWPKLRIHKTSCVSRPSSSKHN